MDKRAFPRSVKDSEVSKYCLNGNKTIFLYIIELITRLLLVNKAYSAGIILFKIKHFSGILKYLPVHPAGTGRNNRTPTKITTSKLLIYLTALSIE